MGSARSDVHAHGEGMFGGINDEECSVHTRYDHSRESLAVCPRVIVNTNFVFTQIDHELERAAWQNAFQRVPPGTQQPQVLDEFAKGWNRSSGEANHESTPQALLVATQST